MGTTKSSITVLLLSILFFACKEKKSGFSVETIPNPMQQAEYVSNPDHIISAATTEKLNGLMDGLKKEGTAQVVIVLLKTIGDKVPKDVVHEIFRTWKPGQKDKNNGLVVLLVDDQHRIEFETGYGLEGDLPDVICFRIQQQKMLPLFRKNNYDEGMWQGMNAVVSVLHHDSTTTVAETLDIDNYQDNFAETPPRRELPGEGTFFLYIFYIGLSRLFAGFFIKKKEKEVNNPPALYVPGLFSGLWIYVFPAVIMFSIAWFTTYSFHWWTMPVIFYLNWLSYLIYRILVININATRHFSEDRHLRYEGLNLALKNFYIYAVIFPIPLYPIYKWHLSRMRHLRNDSYPCEQCNTPMQLLKKKGKSKFLQEGQLAEEKIGSVVYDVWYCKACDKTKVLGYDSPILKAVQCPKCNNKTLRDTRKVVTKHPTKSSKGEGMQYSECKFCNHTEKVPYVIAMLSSSDSSGSSSGSSSWSSSDSSSSSSSSDSSGGDSGGGGAGSSW
ncbi:YgcG family protein [Chitinophaga sp. CF118]|uniref:TPM domain-containing protein n=1 Tax=Chitinophaga sp. CF118 TaxID=1884367 RepID=UPI0015A5C947|nr:TPM domain-containing protein [Chitinophaga sp. CF118]